MAAPVQPRSKGDWTHGARHRHAIRDRRRDAGGVSAVSRSGRPTSGHRSPALSISCGTFAAANNKVGVEIIGRLKPGVSMESARAQLAAWDSNQSATTDRTMSIALVPRRGTVPQPLEAIAVFSPLFVAFGLILLIGLRKTSRTCCSPAVWRVSGKSASGCRLAHRGVALSDSC